MWWIAWCVGTNPAASTMAFSPAKGARVSSRGASDGTSTTPAGETHTYYHTDHTVLHWLANRFTFSTYILIFLIKFKI